jgi:predicted CXXCH cytochrome family protein
MTLLIRHTLSSTIALVFMLAFHAQDLSAVSIIDSKHNLSTSGVGTVKAVTETQICVFCHTPHKALSDAPLWNRSMSNASYQLFTSGTLLSPTSPAIQPDGDSKLCLSCHDGTIAVGSVVNIGGAPSTISMQGVTGGGELPPASPSYVGTDLSGHHPVSIELNSALVVDKNTQCTGGVISWKVCIPTAGSFVKLQPTDNTYPYGGVPPRQGVQCTSCHDPHKDPNPPNTAFLRVGDRVNTDQLCTSCHADCYMSCP